jgi:hypothetical protein
MFLFRETLVTSLVISYVQNDRYKESTFSDDLACLLSFITHKIFLYMGLQRFHLQNHLSTQNILGIFVLGSSLLFKD